VATEPVKIVVVDDNPDGRELMARILRREGFEVAEAATGKEALRLAAGCPNLMVLDVELPDLDGFEVCRRIKADPRTASVVVLQVSAAFRQSVDRIRGLEGGADAYLTLPAQRTEIIATVHALLRMGRAEREAASLRAVTHLANAAAHEINNPLMIIKGQLHLLTRDPAIPPARVAAIADAVDRIGEIVRRMMHVSRVETEDQGANRPGMLDLDRSSPDRDSSA